MSRREAEFDNLLVACPNLRVRPGQAYRYSSSALSSRTVESEKMLDHANIEQAEISLQESGSLSYEVSSQIFYRRYTFLYLRTIPMVKLIMNFF